jgi:hypothetical protein
MNTFARQEIRSLAAGLCLLALLAGASPAADPASPKSAIRKWPAPARAIARVMLEKYGKPAQFDDHLLVWFNKGAWKKTIVARQGLRRAADGTQRDFLQQTVGYIVPEAKVAELKRFNDRVEVSTTAGELTFTSNSEATNLLALNLADEIVTGKRSVADARAFFTKTTRLSASGKSSPYRDGLRFEVDNTRVMTPTGGDR